jgi:hypothetical protein
MEQCVVRFWHSARAWPSLRMASRRCAGEGVACKKLHEWQLPGGVAAVCFAPDGRHLAAANANGTVYILRLPV